MMYKVKKILGATILALILLIALPSCGARESMRLGTALYARNLAQIQEAAENGTNLDAVFVEGKTQNPILYVWRDNPCLYAIEKLLQCGASANYKDGSGHTLLMYASGYQPQHYLFDFAYQGMSSDDVAQLLLDYGASIDVEDKRGWTALDYAATLIGSPNIMRLLLANGATVTEHTLEAAANADPESLYDYEKMHLLTTSMKNEESQSALPPCVFRAMQGADVNEQEFGGLSDKMKNLTLYYVAAFGKPTILAPLLDEIPAPMELQDYNERSLLYVSAKSGNVAVFRYLFDKFQWNEDEKKVALEIAVTYGHPQVTRSLLEAGVTFRAPTEPWHNYGNWLLNPATNGDLETIQLLLAYGYPLDRERAWYTMLNAARGGQIEVLKFFLNSGYPLEIPEFETLHSDSVLQAACSFGEIETVRFLVEQGVDVNGVVKALPIATEQHNVELVTYLLAQGADPHRGTEYDDGSYGTSAYEIAERYGMIDCLQMFDSIGQKDKERQGDGSSVLAKSQKGDDISENSDINK